VLVVWLVWLLLVVSWACSWLVLETGGGLGLALEVYLGGKGYLILGGGQPPGEGMAALCLVNLVGMRGGSWLAVGFVVGWY